MIQKTNDSHTGRNRVASLQAGDGPPPSAPRSESALLYEPAPPRGSSYAPLTGPHVPDKQLPLWNWYYLNVCPTPADPTIVWGTDVEVDATQAYLRRLNDDSPVLVTLAHVLLRATGIALAKHPQFNRRVLRRHVYDYRAINIVMPFQKKLPAEIDLMLFERPDATSLVDLASQAWSAQQAGHRGEYAVGRKHFHTRLPRWLLSPLHKLHVFLQNNVNRRAVPTTMRQRACSTMVNYLGFKGAPPLRGFKPSRYPYEAVSVNVTMGAPEPRPVVADGEVVVRMVAPLFVRADHRLVDAYDIGAFTATLRSLIADPASMDPLPPTGKAVNRIPAEAFHGSGHG